MNTKINPQYRQGDVFIERLDSLTSTNLKARPRQGGRLILAAGSVTGHHHAIAGEHAELFDLEGRPNMVILEVRETSDLTHEEHAAIPIPPGLYRVSIQKEYSPQAIRNVAD